MILVRVQSCMIFWFFLSAFKTYCALVPASCFVSWNLSRTFSSMDFLIGVLSGWAMSLNVPSDNFLLGITTKRPFLPSMTFRPLTTNELSKVIDAYAFNFWSSDSFVDLGKTLTSVISIPFLLFVRQ